MANPNTIGVAYSSSMMVPCMVNNSLYCSYDRNCIPGRASSARISSAITPPTMKKNNDVEMYMTPISFGSVVRRYPSNFTPGRLRATGYARGRAEAPQQS